MPPSPQPLGAPPLPTASAPLAQAPHRTRSHHTRVTARPHFGSPPQASSPAAASPPPTPSRLTTPRLRHPPRRPHRSARHRRPGRCPTPAPTPPRRTTRSGPRGVNGQSHTAPAHRPLARHRVTHRPRARIRATSHPTHDGTERSDTRRPHSPHTPSCSAAAIGVCACGASERSTVDATYVGGAGRAEASGRSTPGTRRAYRRRSARPAPPPWAASGHTHSRAPASPAVVRPERPQRTTGASAPRGPHRTTGPSAPRGPHRTTGPSAP
ncbi:hypothetical protein HNP84_004952 [Thermocatellispora tengchongensis]|uniref:Uncharacterized protein n=1 Tax=Thermocatellispora tengchongensis TaxID=1073253 RepID=A0A840P9A5_9ACTN|nr:hypothetical protein [Thermocatellispora tengchongensis]